jgi:transporter family protein
MIPSGILVILTYKVITFAPKVKKFPNIAAFYKSIFTSLRFAGSASIDKILIYYNNNPMWIIFALLSAFFAALTSILAKIGIQDVNSNLATAIRTVVVLIMAWVIVFVTGRHNDIIHIGQKNLLFLILSGIATGLSWLCYYKALQIGEVSKVMPIDKFSLVIGMVMAFVILRETVTIKTIIGGVFITIGTFVLIL